MCTEDTKRGVIQNRSRATQINNFKNLRYGNITPTDIDGFIDFGNRYFIYIEVKLLGNDLPYGQRLALERLCDATQRGGVSSITYVVKHNVQNFNDDVDVGDLYVSEYRQDFKWHEQVERIKLKDAITKMCFQQ